MFLSIDMGDTKVIAIHFPLKGNSRCLHECPIWKLKLSAAELLFLSGFESYLKLINNSLYPSLVF